jgi:hypothetical protein
MKSLLVVGSLHWDIVVNAPHIPGCDETVLGHSVNYILQDGLAKISLVRRF